MFGNDLGQILDGVDYGGEVSSYSFGSGTGWDPDPEPPLHTIHLILHLMMKYSKWTEVQKFSLLANL